jgi:glycosyltransferase involved in cell wall biosynthesis
MKEAMDECGAVLFIHGRPGPHPFHGALANSVGANFVFCDPFLRWHDRSSSLLRRALSSLITALFLPRKGKYALLLSESPHVQHVLMRKLGILRRRQRIAALLDCQTLYFLHSRFYSPRTVRYFGWLLLQYDALICVGQMQADMARGIISGDPSAPEIVMIPSAVAESRVPQLLQAKPDLTSETIVFVGRGGGGWRSWYKGLDLLLEAFAIARKTRSNLKIKLVGHWDAKILEDICRQLKLESDDATEYVGETQDIAAQFSQAALYLHLGRGDAFAISVLEAMLAGVPAIVSNWTGAKEAVERVDPRFVVDLDAKQAAERILWYFDLPLEQKERLSAATRAVAMEYTEARAIDQFRQAVSLISSLPRSRPQQE